VLPRGPRARGRRGGRGRSPGSHRGRRRFPARGRNRWFPRDRERLRGPVSLTVALDDRLSRPRARRRFYSMSEAVQLAKAARELLAGALNALQADDQVPGELLEVAEPIAKAMSVLHRVERTSGQNLEGRDTVLLNVRSALEKVQKIDSSHPAI